jgi:hypothetical protein
VRKTDRTGSGSCPVEGSEISGTETLSSVTTEFYLFIYSLFNDTLSVTKTIHQGWPIRSAAGGAL